MGVSSFRWHNSSFLPAVAIYNGHRSVEGYRNPGTQKKKTRKKHSPADKPDIVRNGETSKLYRVQSAKMSSSIQSLSEVADTYGKQIAALSRKSLGSACYRQSQQTFSSDLKENDGEDKRRAKVWDRLSVPRHVRSRSTTSCISHVSEGIAAASEGRATVQMTEEMRQQRPRQIVPNRLNYLNGFFLKRPPIKTFEPFLKKHHRQPANIRRNLVEQVATTAILEPGIHIQLPIAKKPGSGQ